ncbi:MAG: 4Fe-4S binding protein [Comamonadaceae bacterium]|nr:4Fe-4S binding protein [Comamonadaceae bacterium]
MHVLRHLPRLPACASRRATGARSREVDKPESAYEYVVDENKCIGCAFCAGICPCGVWEMEENV